MQARSPGLRAWWPLLSLALLASSPGAQAQPRPAAEAAKAEPPRPADAHARALERVRPSLVRVEATVAAPDGEGTSLLGVTGFVVGEGLVMTTNRAVERALSLQVRLADGRVVEGKLGGRDALMDVALVRVDARAPAARLGADGGVAAGAAVVAASWASGARPSLAAAVVGAPGRGGWGSGEVSDLLLADVASAGDGAPVVDAEGTVLGMQSVALGRRAGRPAAVTAGTLRRLLAALSSRGKVERPTTGAQAQDLTAPLAEALGLTSGHGALLAQVLPGGPAAAANLKAGDVVVALDGRPIRSAEELAAEVAARDPGASVTLEVVRSGKHYGTSLKLGARSETLPPAPLSAPPSARGLGLVVRDGVGSEGAPAACSVEAVVAGSAAERAGLSPGDLVLEADGLARPTAAQVQQQGADGKLLLRVKRRDRVLFVALR